LHDYRSGQDMAARRHVLYLQGNEITPPQLAVDRKVEHGKVTGSVPQLEANPAMRP